MPITRTFTVAEFEEIGVPFELDGDGCAEELQIRHIESRRWAALKELVFRHPEDGIAYSVRYQVGLTEHQECDPFYDDPVTATAVEQREVTVTKWLPVEATS
jgi:hypothetical protein